MDWHFSKTSQREGLTASAVTIFQGDRLAGTVREVIQNSLDAGTGSRVSVGFSLKLHPTVDLPGVSKLKKYLDLAYKEVLVLKAREDSFYDDPEMVDIPEDVSFYRRAKETVAQGEVLMLGIHDWGTTGLVGPTQEAPGQRPESWLGLVRGRGVNVKSQEDSLGSFGQGSMAPVALSKLSTLFYLSRIENGEQSEDRFIGKTLLSSMWLEGDKGEPYLSAATGFFSTNEEADPILGSEIPEWATSARAHLTDLPGTSVFIPAPFIDLDQEDFEREILYAVLLNFYFAISSGKLEIVLPNGDLVNAANVREATSDSLILGSDSVDPEKLETLRTLYYSREPNVGIRKSEVFGEFSFAIRVGEDLPGRKVGIARKTGMLITRNAPKFAFQGLANFDLFICVTSKEGSQVLREFENPQHDSFEFDRVAEAVKRDSYRKKYEKFAQEVRELAKEFAELASSEVTLVSDLTFLLGNYESTDEDQVRVEFPERMKVASRKRRSKHEVIGPGNEVLGPTGMGGGEGHGSGGGGNLPGDSPGGGSGPHGKKLKKATEALLEVDTKSRVHILHFSVHDYAEASELFVYRSGEVGRDGMRFSLEKDGPLVGSIPKSNWSSVGKKGRHRFRVEFIPEAAPDSVEAFISVGDTDVV